MRVEVVFERNRSFADSLAGDSQGGLPWPAARPASPWLVVVACMDPRIPVEKVLGLSPGEAFVVRTPAAAIDGVAAAGVGLALAVDSVTSALVVGHTDCAAVASAIRASSGEANEAQRVLAGCLPTLAPDVDPREGAEMVVAESTRRISELARARRGDSASVEVRGAIYELGTARLCPLSRGAASDGVE
ncbi:MAG: beta-carbonic anhydrase 1 [Acidimicrobiales bacterium]|nr:MAG: beta-carbonic anhydrase 1 [Acidimicrobiales bacterium]